MGRIEMSSTILVINRRDNAPRSITIALCDPRRAWVRIRGALDWLLTAELEAVLTAQLEAGRRYLRLDLTGVTYIDPAAIEVIVRAHHRVLARRGTLVLNGVPEPINRALVAADPDRVLLIGGPRAELDPSELLAHRSRWRVAR